MLESEPAGEQTRTRAYARPHIKHGVEKSGKIADARHGKHDGVHSGTNITIMIPRRIAYPLHFHCDYI